MPPKKKAKAKKKKNEDDELILEEKYQRTQKEVDSLKDQLSVRKELRRRAQYAMEGYRQRATEAEEELQTQVNDQRMSSANMTRQYKSMQSEMSVKIHNLERELHYTQQKLFSTEDKLKAALDAKEASAREREATVEKLEKKLVHMERAFENLIHESIDNLLANILKVRTVWEQKSLNIQAINKQQLLEFGLNPLQI